MNKILIIISTNDQEKAFNALRFANHAKSKALGTSINPQMESRQIKNEVDIFLLGQGVEITQSTDYDIQNQITKFCAQDGNMHSCGTCLVSRNQSAPPYCPSSTMEDLYRLTMESDKVITF